MLPPSGLLAVASSAVGLEISGRGKEGKDREEGEIAAGAERVYSHISVYLARALFLDRIAPQHHFTATVP